MKRMLKTVLQGAAVLFSVLGMTLVYALLGPTPVHAIDSSEYIMIQMGASAGLSRFNPDGTGYQVIRTQNGLYGGGWSQDGHYFAYRLFNDAGQHWTVGIYDADAQQDQGVITNGSYMGWTPDGRVVYAPLGAPAGSYEAINLQTHSVSSYSYGTPQYSHGFEYSPDGRYLLYGSNDGEGDIFIALKDLSTGGVTRLAEGGGEGHWSQVGRLVFESQPDGAQYSQTYVYDVGSGQPPRNISPSPNADATLPSISPDGTEVAYETYNEQAGGPVTYIRTVPNGTPRLLQAESSSYYLYPQWRPRPVAHNQAPQVTAGSDKRATTSDNVSLDGVVADDGLPATPGHTTATWSKLSGPGSVTFASANAPQTTAYFSQPGTYQLRLSATDGSLSAADEVTVKIVDHYQVEFKSWIPSQTFANPLILKPFSYATQNIALLANGPIKTCFQNAAAGRTGSLQIDTSFILADGHANYGLLGSTEEDYRIKNSVSFDFDGTAISNFAQTLSPLTTYTDIQVHMPGRPATHCLFPTTRPSESQPATATSNGFTIRMHGSTPLAPRVSDIVAACRALGGTAQLCQQLAGSVPLELFAPSIDGSVHGVLEQDGTLTFDYTTDLFPSYGIGVQRNGHFSMSPVINSVACYPSTGSKAAATLLLGLQTPGLGRNQGVVAAGSPDKACDPTAISPGAVNALAASLDALSTPTNERALLIAESYLAR